MNFLLYILILPFMVFGEEVPAQLLHCDNLLGHSTNLCMYWCEVTDGSLLWQIAGESFIVNSSAQDGAWFFQGQDFNFTSVIFNITTMMVAIGILPSQPNSNGVTCSSTSHKNATVSTEHANVASSNSSDITLQFSFAASFSSDIMKQLRVFWCGVPDEFVGWLFSNNRVRGFDDEDKIGDSFPLRMDNNRTAVVMLYAKHPLLVSLLLVVGPPNYTVTCTNLKNNLELNIPDSPTEITSINPKQSDSDATGSTENSGASSIEFHKILSLMFLLLSLSYNVVAEATISSITRIPGGLVAVIVVIISAALILVSRTISCCVVCCDKLKVSRPLLQRRYEFKFKFIRYVQISFL